jgi:hypothetical protein
LRGKGGADHAGDGQASAMTATGRVAAGLAALALLLFGVLLLGAGGSTGASGGGPEFYDAEVLLAVEHEGGQYVVSIHKFIAVAAGEDPGAAVAAAREEVLGRFAGAVELDEGVSAQFVLTPYKWQESTASWAYNPSGKPGALSGDGAAIAAGANAWNGAGGSPWSFTGGGSTSAGTGACTGGQNAALDQQNTVGWKAQSSANVLAVTCTWYNGDRNSPDFGAAVEFDMEFAPKWNWTTATPIPGDGIDLRSVATHEFGHALGLGHTQYDVCSETVMLASYKVGTDRRELRPDDVNGVVALYGGTPDPRAVVTCTPTPTPTATQTRTATLTPTQTMTPTPTPTPTVTPVPFPPSLLLQAGANLVTWPGSTVAPASLEIPEGLAAIYWYDAPAGGWERYIPSAPAYVSNLGELRAGEAYWFLTTHALAIRLR